MVQTLRGPNEGDIATMWMHGTPKHGVRVEVFAHRPWFIQHPRSAPTRCPPCARGRSVTPETSLLATMALKL